MRIIIASLLGLLLLCFYYYMLTMMMLYGGLLCWIEWIWFSKTKVHCLHTMRVGITTKHFFSIYQKENVKITRLIILISTILWVILNSRSLASTHIYINNFQFGRALVIMNDNADGYVTVVMKITSFLTKIKRKFLNKSISSDVMNAK